MMPSSDSFSTEIERKFLLKRVPDNLEKYPRAEIEQGYLAIDSGGHHVRLRKKGDARSLTYKRDYGMKARRTRDSPDGRSVRSALAGNGRT